MDELELGLAKIFGRQYFFANGKKCYTHHKCLTGGEVKRLGRLNLNYHLCYENESDDGYPWHFVGDGENVNLMGTPKHFWCSPPATAR